MPALTLNNKDHDQARLVTAAVHCLQAGGLLIFPTETTYGAGVDATNPAAVAKLLAYKSRREGKPLSIAVRDAAMAAEFVEINDQAQQVYQRFLPGPVTVVSKSLGTVAPGVASEFGTLGVRISSHPLVAAIVAAFGKPITATSANGSGEKRPYTIADIMAGLSNKQAALIDVILDAGTLPPNPPSTVIDTTLSTPVTLRQGALVLEPNASQHELHSNSEAETKAIAGRLVLKHWNSLTESGLVITLDGALGTGKTVFAKGVAEFLQIAEPVTSPTYTYIEEYPFIRHSLTGQLHHLDLWKVDSAQLLDRLAVPTLFGPGRVVVIEWWQQVASFATELGWQLPKPWLQVQFSEMANQPEARTLLISEVVDA